MARMQRWKEKERKKGLTEPPLVSSDPSRRSVLLSLLESSLLRDLSVSIPDGLSSVEKLLLSSSGGRDVEILSCERGTNQTKDERGGGREGGKFESARALQRKLLLTSFKLGSSRRDSVVYDGKK